MNLHEFSQNNNIEAGVLSEKNSRYIGSFANVVGIGDLNSDANKFFQDVLSNSELLYKKTTPSGTAISNTGSNVFQSTIEIDIIDDYHENPNTRFDKHKSVAITMGSNEPSIPTQKHGFCIRTGERIPFDLNMPFCKNVHFYWLKWANPKYQENYCHFTGEASDGNTCFATPILKKIGEKLKKSTIFNVI